MFMQFKDIKVNNRLQVESEHDNPIYRNIKGIVLSKDDKTVLLVTDFGELVEIYKENILSVTQIQFPKIISDSLMNLKNHYQEIYELNERLKVLEKRKPKLQNNLFDANFLSKFNIEGAKNRIEKSIDSSLLSFRKEPYSFHITFDSNPNDQIEILVTIGNHFEYYNLDEIGNVDKIIRRHAPDFKDALEKEFSYATEIMEGEQMVVHEQDSMYVVRSTYKILVDVNQESFMDVRAKIQKSLKALKR